MVTYIMAQQILKVDIEIYWKLFYSRNQLIIIIDRIY